MTWPAAEQLETHRLLLEPISVDHAVEMVGVLADPVLFAYTGGEPPTLDELQRRYRAQSVGESSDGTQWWLNWVIRRKASGLLIGFSQATVRGEPLAACADLAWLVAPEAQGQGVATQATRAVTGWLRSQGVNSFAAFIRPDHRASMSVAKNLGLAPTPTTLDGEIRWESPAVRERTAPVGQAPTRRSSPHGR